jgi:antirestriction protein ArdC
MESFMQKENQPSIFDRVTSRIIADLEKGVRPWQKPWTSGRPRGLSIRPLRHGGEPYNGINVILLWDAASEKGYHSQTWMTFNQALEYGGSVRKGEKATSIVYARKLLKQEENATTGEMCSKSVPLLKGYSVFNTDQIDNLPAKFVSRVPEPSSLPRPEKFEKIEEFVRHAGARIKSGGDEAYYAEKTDHIQLPFIETFRDSESYYATMAHELTHWTKHETRTDRNFGKVRWGDAGYAREELVAEIGSAFLCADLGITPEVRPDHAAYIHHWLDAMKEDKRLIFTAAAHASRAVEFLKAKQPAPAAHPPAFEPVRKPEVAL